MLSELFKYILGWPIFVIAFIAVGTIVLKCGGFFSECMDWLRDKHRRNKP